jgi:uncharacterized membrane protein
MKTSPLPSRIDSPGGIVASLFGLAPVVAAFAMASVTGVALLAIRWLVTGHLPFYYLPWNLGLAWIPFGLAVATRWLVEAGCGRRWLALISGGGWLLFFPNAPYLCTDLVHLVQLQPSLTAPLWFDLLANLIFAVTGLLLGFASLTIMQGLVCRARGGLAGWFFALVVLGLAGFGIYLGRFHRWNSWDALFSPWAVLVDVAEHFVAPHQHWRAWGFSAVCSLFLLMSYAMCQALGRLQPAARTHGESQ